MTKKPNPFAKLVSEDADPDRPMHATDDPGRDYDQSSAESEERTKSSGPSGLSEPRRPGGGTRQAPRRQTEEPLSPDEDPIIPGEILYADEDVIINEGLDPMIAV
ncbi:hypothetical protein ACFSUD_18955 [Sulfitobacter aestuarii]|uniref:Uncharacterized protein n=1 Tax=Sulfitobacter aestuarii TaxID=2161676 RepID=A0ABW5U8N3_9RHOB